MTNGRKVVVVTGASAGIGAGVALHLARRGHSLVLAARRLPELEAVAREAEAAGAPRAVAVRTDVRNREEVFRLRDAALGAFGAYDVWIIIAGRGITRPVLELTDADVDEMMSVNLKSALYGMQAAVPDFIKHGRGHIINISSFLGRVPLATQRSAYNAAKAALNALTANLRVDLAGAYPDIHVSLVMPGIVSTNFARNVVGPGTPTAPRWSAMPIQTVGEVAESIAGLIEHPVPELYTNPASADLARRYFEDVAAFEARMAGPRP
jgi:NAD(P)-dependent dehydrogenase (short-subunit alcohol dehydrogenase family)